MLGKKSFWSSVLSVPVFLMLLAVQAHSAESIKIGVVTALSAPGGVETGKALLAGAEIAADVIKNNGGLLGRPVELVVGDTAGTPEKGTAVMERFVSKDKVVAVAGELHSSVALAEIEVAHREGVPIVISEAWADDVTAKGYPEVFRVTVSNSLIYSKAAVWAKDSGFKHIAVIAENSDWGLGVINVFKENLEKAGVKVTSMTAERQITDFTPQLLQLKRMEPPVDFIVDGFTGAAELLMIKQAYQLGIAPTAKTAILGAGMDVLYKDFWETAGDAGVYTLANPAGLPGIPKTDELDKFNKLFTEKYGREADAVAMEGYDSVMIIAKAIEKANSADPKDITKAIAGTNWVGTRGTVTFPNDPAGPAWTNNQWMDVPIFIIQYTEKGQDPSKAAILWPAESATVSGYIVPPAK